MSAGPLLYLKCQILNLFFTLSPYPLICSDMAEHSTPTCGVDGKPPLRDWIFGTGVSFITIAISFSCVGNKEDTSKVGFCDLIAALSSIFLFCWAVVGAVSLGRDGKDCSVIDVALWRVGVAAVVFNWVVWGCGVTVVHSSGVMQLGGGAVTWSRGNGGGVGQKNEADGENAAAENV